ncbi:MAG: hypothetical protein JO266_19045 [Acidobacteria bacterium]|nr:hypothetical protein [Acidobacteriota bacterium]
MQNPTLDMRSGNYRALDEGGYEPGGILDEVVIVFDSEHQNETTLHLEQMNARDWFLRIGDLQFSVRMKKPGQLEMVLYGGGGTVFKDKRGEQ